MKRFVLTLSFFMLCLLCIAQNKEELSFSLHNNLLEGNYLEAKKDMIKLRRKLDYELLDGNNCLFAEYLRLCVKSNIEIDEESEAKSYIIMLENVYQDEPEKIRKQLLSILKCCYEANDGYLANMFYNKLFEYDRDMPLEKQAYYKYQIAWAYNYSSNPYLAYKFFKECAIINKQIGDSVEYAHCLNGIAYVCKYLGKNDLSLPLYKHIGQIFSKKYGKLSKEYAINCDNIGSGYYFENELDSALKYRELSYKILKQLNDTTEDMSILLNNIANCYNAPEDRNMKLSYLEQSLQYDETNTAYFNIGSIYQNERNYSKALDYFFHTTKGYQESDCAPNIAECYAAIGDIQGFIDYENLYFDYVTQIQRNNFKDMIDKDRVQYCTQGRNCKIDSLFRIANRLNIEEINSLCYNTLLREKSRSLSCDRSIESIVETASPKIKKLYSQLLLAKKYKVEDPLKYDSLETAFLKALQDETDYTDFLQIKHSDIAAQLKYEDVAIEFYEADEHDDNRIYALILKPDGKVYIKNIGSKNNTAHLLNIWVTLDSVLNEIRNIYFSPDGILHTLPIESYSCASGKTYSFYRLSSTKELAFYKKSIGQNAAIYGGLAYNMSIDNMVIDANKYSMQKNSEIVIDSTNRWVIGEIKELPGTKTESIAIAETIKLSGNKNIMPELFAGKEGTEASFKNLSGKNTRIIHIATHGFYDKNSDFITKMGPLKSNYNDDLLNTQNVEDVSLKRCGLYFAGANNKYLGEDVPNGVEDGILTAHEISLLDLRGLDLVTLSACETALGDINGDGVFGLQRGFKKAGANSILMSLWKVDDNATCLLMTEFYKNWIGNGMTKSDALEAAKQTVRSHTEKGWDDPKYWAAFILLDALD